MGKLRARTPLRTGAAPGAAVLLALSVLTVPPLSSGSWAAQALQKRTSWTAETVLAHLDHAAKKLHSLTAEVERTKVTVVVNDRSTESGQILLRTDDKMLIDLTQPDQRRILRNGDKLWIYLPKSKRLEEYDLGKHRSVLDQFLSLGLGSSGNSLKKQFLLTVLGEEEMDSRKTVLLELVPREERFRNQIDRIHLWVDTSNWLSLQQKFFETGSGDYFVIHYRNIITNVKLSETVFKPNWPKDVTRVKPQS